MVPRCWGLGISISLDELAIGFSLGSTHLPVIPVIIGIGVQAFRGRPTRDR
jgi:putative Mn2+ efflux pump MntP